MSHQVVIVAGGDESRAYQLIRALMPEGGREHEGEEVTYTVPPDLIEAVVVALVHEQIRFRYVPPWP